MTRKFLTVMLISTTLISVNASAQELVQPSVDDSSLDENLTEIVVVSLVLGFSYSVLQGFKGK